MEAAQTTSTTARRCWRAAAPTPAATGDDAGGDGGGDAGLGLDATAPPFIPAASEDSEVPRRKDRGESPARGDAATSLEGAAKQAGLRGGVVRWQAGVLRCCWTTTSRRGRTPPCLALR